MTFNITSYVSRIRSFSYPNPNKLRSGYWTIANAPFFPILRSDQLAQSNCPKKMNFMYLCGSSLDHIPESQYYQDPQGNRFPFGYSFCSEVFNRIIINILSAISVNHIYNQALSQSPQNNPIWDQIFRNQLQNELGMFSQLLYNDLFTFFSRLYLFGENLRYLDHPESILFKSNILSPTVYLDHANPTRIFTIDTRLQHYNQILNINMRWKGPFPLISTIDAIDLENHEIINYFYFREDFLQPKPDWTIGNVIEDTYWRHQEMIYHSQYHQLWLSRLALMNLELNKTLNFNIRLAFQSIFTPNYPQFLLNQINNPNGWFNYFSNFRLRLETIDNTYYPINDYTDDTVRALIYTNNAIMQRNWENEFLETPCFDAMGRRDMYCNFCTTCRRRRNSQVIPTNFREEVFRWQCAIKDHLIMEDEELYCIMEFLPQFCSYFLDKNQLWIGDIINFNNNIIEVELDQRILNKTLPNKDYLIVQWTPFFFFYLLATCRSHQNPNRRFFHINELNDAWRNWYNFTPRQKILILDFEEESRRNELLQQKTLYDLSTFHPTLGTQRGQLTSPNVQNIRNLRLSRGGIKASEATYGGGVRYL